MNSQNKIEVRCGMLIKLRNNAYRKPSGFLLNILKKQRETLQKRDNQFLTLCQGPRNRPMGNDSSKKAETPAAIRPICSNLQLTLKYLNIPCRGLLSE